MAFYPNPAYGYVPGAPQATHRWIGNQFVMSDLPPVPPPPLPPVSTAATVTPQDVATQVGAGMLAPQQYGGTGGSGGPGGGPGGIGGASGGGQDTTTSGYQGVYAQTPIELNSQFGMGLGIAGGAVPYPGAATALGMAGSTIDAGRYNGVLGQYGIPGTVNPITAALSAIPESIGVPFTNYNLATLFGAPTARQQYEDILRTNLAAVGPTTLNSSMPGAANATPAYGAIQANAPVGPAVVGAPPSASYPAGFAEWSGGIAGKSAAQGSAAWTGLGPQDKSNVDPNDFGGGGSGKGGGTADPGAGGKGDAAPGGSGGTSSNASSGGSSSQGSGGGSKGGGDKGGGDRDTGLYFSGGLIGPPPGRYEQGGRVRRATPSDDIAALRNALFGNMTAALPMPEYDDHRRLQRRIYDPADYAGLRYAPDERATMSTTMPPDPGNEHIHHPWPYPDDAPGRYAAGGAVRAGARLPTYRDPVPPGGFEPRTYWSDDRGVPSATYGNDPAAGREPPPVTPHERNLQDFIYEMLRAQGRDVFPEQLARGGVVSPAGDANITPQQFGLLRGIDPPGPDDQIGALQTGEGVITRKAMGKGWGGLLGPINAGKLDPAKLKGLLVPAPKARRLR